MSDVLDSERLALGDADISLSEDVPATLTVQADPEQLYRVIFNLVRNARQALAQTGEAGEISVAAADLGSVWEIRVSDTGPGLPPKAREHLFQPFQGGARKGGSGLGLVIAQDLIRGHGGQLTLEQTGPDGTTFVITLPKEGE